MLIAGRAGVAAGRGCCAGGVAGGGGGAGGGGRAGGAGGVAGRGCCAGGRACAVASVGTTAARAVAANRKRFLMMILPGKMDTRSRSLAGRSYRRCLTAIEYDRLSKRAQGGTAPGARARPHQRAGAAEDGHWPGQTLREAAETATPSKV